MGQTHSLRGRPNVALRLTNERVEIAAPAGIADQSLGMRGRRGSQLNLGGERRAGGSYLRAMS